MIAIMPTMPNPKTRRIHVANFEHNNALKTFSSSHNERSHPEDEVRPHGQERTSGVLLNALKPLFISMTCVGILDYRNIMKDARRETVRGKCVNAYRSAVMSLLVANFLRFSWAYSDSSNSGSELLTNIMIHTWFLQCSVNMMVCYTIVKNPNKLRLFFTLWDNYWKKVNDSCGNNTGEMDNKSIGKTIRKVTAICTVIGWTFVVGNVLFAFYLCVYTTTTFEHLLTPLSKSHSKAPIATAVYLVVQFYLTAVWIFTWLAMFLIQLSLYYSVKQFATVIEEQIKCQQFSVIRETMEAWRYQYNELCNIIDVVDDIFRFNLGLSLITYVVLVLILVYNTLWYESVRNSPPELMTQFFWLSGIATMLVTSMSVCCLVNSWVRISMHSSNGFIFVSAVICGWQRKAQH